MPHCQKTLLDHQKYRTHAKQVLPKRVREKRTETQTEHKHRKERKTIDRGQEESQSFLNFWKGGILGFGEDNFQGWVGCLRQNHLHQEKFYRLCVLKQVFIAELRIVSPPRLHTMLLASLATPDEMISGFTNDGGSLHLKGPLRGFKFAVSVYGHSTIGGKYEITIDKIIIDYVEGAHRSFPMLAWQSFSHHETQWLHARMHPKISSQLDQFSIEKTRFLPFKTTPQRNIKTHFLVDRV